MWHFTNWLLAEAQSDPWSSPLFGLDENQRFVVVIVALGCVTGIIITIVSIAYCWIDGAHKRRVEMELKREMLDRGMSADEIAKIIKATPDLGKAEAWASAWAGWPFGVRSKK